MAPLHEVKIVLDSGFYILAVTDMGQFRVMRVSEDDTVHIEKYGERLRPRLPRLAEFFGAIEKYEMDGDASALSEFLNDR